jgi:excisionase family DNA binding protein
MIQSPWLSVSDAAMYLSKSEDAIRGLLKRGIIPPKRLGKTIYIDRRALDEQIQNSSGGRLKRQKVGQKLASTLSAP